MITIVVILCGVFNIRYIIKGLFGFRYCPSCFISIDNEVHNKINCNVAMRPISC